jgi:YVTN family beta-propeller protein
VDTQSWSVVATVPLGTNAGPIRAVFAPDSSKVYVSLINGDQIAVISNAGAASAVIGSIPTGDGPFEMVMNTNGTKIYVINSGAPHTIGVVDTVAQSQVATIPAATGRSAGGLALSPDQSRLYVAYGSGTYTIGNAYVTVAQSGALSVINTATNGVIEDVPGPHLMAGLAMAGNGSMLAMPNLMSEGLTLVSLGGACYANCDGSTTAPVLNVGDFTCFLQRFAAGEPYANCDQSTTPPVLNVGDFTCFLQRFAGGCN